MNHDDLAIPLLRHMGIGWSVQNGVAAAEAFRIKAFQPGFNVSTAYMFILKQWGEYKKSQHYGSQFRRKAAAWLSEGDYDNPQSWGGRPILAHQEKPRQMSDVERWQMDKREHPENYPTSAETKE